jgi:hypothetical protein
MVPDPTDAGRRHIVKRFFGTGLIFGGVVILSVNVGPLDQVVASVTSSHGVHLSDLVGTAVVAAGTAILWRN